MIVFAVFFLFFGDLLLPEADVDGWVRWRTVLGLGREDEVCCLLFRLLVLCCGKAWEGIGRHSRLCSMGQIQVGKLTLRVQCRPRLNVLRSCSATLFLAVNARSYVARAFELTRTVPSSDGRSNWRFIGERAVFYLKNFARSLLAAHATLLFHLHRL